MLDKRKFYINGQWVNSLVSKDFEVINPSNEEAIAITNNTSYGLTNYVQTQDKEKAKRVAIQLRSGGVEINGKSVSSGTPFGGFKESGNGREGGTWGLEEYLEVKSISGWS